MISILPRQPRRVGTPRPANNFGLGHGSETRNSCTGRARPGQPLKPVSVAPHVRPEGLPTGVIAERLGVQHGSSLPSAKPDLCPHFGLSATAASTTHWGRNLSPLKVSSKREFLRFWPETFGRFSPELPYFGFWRLVEKARKAPKNAGFSPTMCSLSLAERVLGWGGRDRTQTFPIEFRPLKYQENFASKASFSCPETFRPSHNRSGSPGDYS